MWRQKDKKKLFNALHSFNKIKWTDISAVILSAFALVLISKLTYTSNTILENQQKWQEETRKRQIFPYIQLTMETELNQETLEEATIVFENIGNGPAYDIMVWVGNSNQLSLFVRRNFRSFNGSDGYQNYILPGQKLKFREFVSNIYGPSYDSLSFKEKLSLSIRSAWTFYFSYFDIDGNEYLLTTTERPTGVREPILFSKPDSRLDSLFKSIATQDIDKKIYENPGIRNKNRWVIDSLGEKVRNPKENSMVIDTN